MKNRVVRSLVEALEAAETELSRLRDVHLPQYEGKIGEPDEAVLKKVQKALVLSRGCTGID